MRAAAVGENFGPRKRHGDVRRRGGPQLLARLAPEDGVVCCDKPIAERAGALPPAHCPQRGRQRPLLHHPRLGPLREPAALAVVAIHCEVHLGPDQEQPPPDEDDAAVVPHPLVHHGHPDVAHHRPARVARQHRRQRLHRVLKRVGLKKVIAAAVPAAGSAG